MRITYWEQSADFESKEYEEIDLTKAVQIFKSRHWFEEIVVMERLMNSGKEFCPPGIGYVSDEGYILHVCSEEKDNYSIHFIYPTGSKILRKLGLEDQETKSTINLSEEKVILAIENFFNESYDKLMK